MIKTFKFTSIILLIILGNTISGNRSKLNNVNETKAFSAVKIFFSDDNTYVANVVMHTFIRKILVFF